MSHGMSLLFRILEVVSILGAAAIFVAYLFRARAQRSQSASGKHTAFSRQFFIVAILMGVSAACRLVLTGGSGDDRFLNWLLVLFCVFSALFTRLHSSYRGEEKAS